MEEAVVGAVVGATIQVVLQNLLSTSMEEISLIWNFKKDLEKLKSSFFMIQDFLEDAEKKQVTEKPVKRWLKKLEAVAFDADNVFDELNYEVLRKKIETKNKMKTKVSSFFSNSNPIASRHTMAQKIKDIKKKLELINQEARDFGLQKRLAVAHAPAAGSDAPDSLETDSLTVDPVFLGRDNDVSRIVEMLTTNPTDQVFSILPIVGMGGLGKTTLVRKVYGDEKIISHFENRIWVHVSENFDPVTVFNNILASLTEENVTFGRREVVLKKLRKSLGDKRYLLVLDNVWNEKTEKWDNFINSLAGISFMKGNGIIVTTRSSNVASIVKTLDLHQLKELSEDDCLSIIKANAFGKGDIPAEFETVGKIIAKRCQGLPLAAKVVGALLRGKPKDEWLSIEENWLSDSGEDGNIVLKILKISFDHLPSPSLKKCFAYCSIFPKGAEIHREKLIELWMAEGFLQTYDQISDMETVGNEVFNLLVQNSLLQVVKRDDYGNIRYCNMHDLVHDLACSVLGPKANDNNVDDISQVRYIWCKSIQKEQARCLRTLFFEGEVSDDMFSDFNCLHVLTLKGYGITELPSSIRKLLHLRYLDISETRIECLPDWIGELYQLETLRAYYLRRQLPDTLKYLINLRHLHVFSNVKLPPEIGRLTSLQTLEHFEVGDKPQIVELGSLKNLKGKLMIGNLEKVQNKEEAQRADLFHKPNIFKLEFVWYHFREGGMNHENVLEGLQPHPNLKSLKVCGFNGISFPLWTLKMAVRDDLEDRWIGLNNLMDITLSHCKECKEIPMLGHLPHLKSLFLWFLTNVRSICSSFYGMDKCSPKNGVCLVFPALQRLWLYDMPNLREWAEVELPRGAQTQLCEVVVFPCLEYLEIKNCMQLMSAPSHFPCLKELNISGMDSGLPLANICGIQLTSLTKLTISRVDGLVCLPDGLFYNNQNLSELKISSCLNLKHLGGGGASPRKLYCSNLIELPHSLNTLQGLTIEDRPNLKSIQYQSGGQSKSGGQSEGFTSLGFTSLRHLTINDCKGLTNLPSEMVESSAPSLERLSLEGLSSLTNLPMVIGYLPKMVRLTSLAIVNVPKFTNSAAVIGSLRNLQELKIGCSSDSLDSTSFTMLLDGIFQELLSLNRVSLYGMEHFDSLPNQLQHLTALTYLEIYDFGIEALPEWFGKLSSLNRLSLRRCGKLRRLPSKEAMRRLTKFSNLFIFDCPLLRQTDSREPKIHDSQWPNISHIPRIFLDGFEISSHIP